MQIVNNVRLNRFEIATEGGLAVLNYKTEGRTLFLVHVHVPEQARSLGVGGKLAQAALTFGRSEKLTVVPQNPFIASYISNRVKTL